MSIALLQNVVATGLNTFAPFQAIGGTSPYVYSVVAGGVGGTINSSTGLYSAPGVTGQDTILVTDAVSNTAQASITVLTPLELVCDIIQNQMGLASDQVYLWDQKIIIPKDSRLYVVVGVISCKPFGNTISLNTAGSGVVGIQSVNMQATLSIDIFSRGPQARDRKEEILMAVESQYSENQQTANSFRVYPISTGFANLSDLDGSAIPYRFNISANIQYFTSKSMQVPYYDTFPTPQIVPDDGSGE